VKALIVAALLALAAPDDGGPIPGETPGPAPAPEDADLRAAALSKLLRCPVCQGLAVSDSTSEAAVAFRGRVRELVDQGYTDRQILAFFVDRYGDFILLDPPAEGLNWVIWVGPGLLTGTALAFALAAAARRRPQGQAGSDQTGPHVADPYEQRLLAELDE
jgi:cytochrome c-type biogenesis protein CcmH